MKIRKSTPIKWRFLCWTTAFATALISQPSLAHWQYTRWGMTPNEVVAASKGKALLVTSTQFGENGETADVGAIHEIAGIKFETVFLFREKRLSMVIVWSEDSQQCRALSRDLLATYGKPSSVKNGLMPRTDWEDQANGNSIAFIEANMGSCILQYEEAPRRSGL
jgi:hypothetical protein